MRSYPRSVAVQTSRDGVLLAAGALAVLLALAVLFVVGMLALPRGARAADLSATTMKVSIWPEYDDPRVLVMYQTALAPDVSLPVDVTMEVPADADVGMACEILPDGGHSCRPYQIVDRGAARGVQYRVEEQRSLFLEYYQAALTAGSGRRSFDVVVRPTFPVDNLMIEVQEPLRSTGFQVVPAAPRSAVDARGLTYHLLDVGPARVGEEVVVSIGYDKPDGEPSVVPVGPAAMTGDVGSGPAAGGAGQDPGSSSGFSVLGVTFFGGAHSVLWLGVLLGGLAALMAGGFLMLRPRAVRGVPASGVPVRGACPSCGGPAGADNRFCTDCGGELS